MAQRFQIDWLNNGIMSVPCEHKDGWCHRTTDPFDERIFPAERECFESAERAWAYLLRNHRENEATAHEEFLKRQRIRQQAEWKFAQMKGE